MTKLKEGDDPQEILEGEADENESDDEKDNETWREELATLRAELAELKTQQPKQLEPLQAELTALKADLSETGPTKQFKSALEKLQEQVAELETGLTLKLKPDRKGVDENQVDETGKKPPVPAPEITPDMKPDEAPKKKSAVKPRWF